MKSLESDTDEKEGQVSLAHSQNNTDITLGWKIDLYNAIAQT